MMTTISPDVLKGNDTAVPASSMRRYTAVRDRTERLCLPLAIEDYVVTAMVDASPTKWHLAHTTWFFETFVLREHAPDYQVYDEAFAYLFNSYYVQAGERHCRAQRGLVTRPTVEEVYKYRHAVDEAVGRLLAGEVPDDVRQVLELGTHHEQQHQELLLTDLKYLFYANPLRPAYDEHPLVGDVPVLPMNDTRTGDAWVRVKDGVAEFGHDGQGFAYDNEGPRHKRYLNAARVSLFPVTNAEYAEFIEDGGYERPELWLSAGWGVAQERGWHAPLYWERHSDAPIGYRGFTLAGIESLMPGHPVCHVSYYEADAYARWRSTRDVPGARLPTEFEWEAVAPDPPDAGDVAPDGGKKCGCDAHGFYGAVWQWTMSPYTGYPGYHPAPGAIGEYNGKFMSDQWVLRGSSIATPPGHTRRTYRNFFPADARWQFSGIRLAVDQP